MLHTICAKIVILLHYLTVKKDWGMISGGDFLAHIQRSRKIKTTFLILGKEMVYDGQIIQSS